VFSRLLTTEKIAPTATTKATIPITRLRVVLSGPLGDFDDIVFILPVVVSMVGATFSVFRFSSANLVTG
jgi:hypothetical protein